MPRGPKGEKRPADVIGAAVMVAKIATGEMDENLPKDGQSKGGKKGGKKRAKILTPQERSDIASIAASARWKKR